MAGVPRIYFQPDPLQSLLRTKSIIARLFGLGLSIPSLSATGSDVPCEHFVSITYDAYSIPERQRVVLYNSTDYDLMRESSSDTEFKEKKSINLS